ncbi:hypothetical protein MAHJHV33_50010 [Mycobacterium avium subsp. hominissuis]
MVAATMPASSSASAVCGGSLSTHRSPGEPGDLCVLNEPPHTALAELDAGRLRSHREVDELTADDGGGHHAGVSAARRLLHWLSKNRCDT